MKFLYVLFLVVFAGNRDALLRRSRRVFRDCFDVSTEDESSGGLHANCQDDFYFPSSSPRWVIIRVYYLKHIYLTLIAVLLAYMPTNLWQQFMETVGKIHVESSFFQLIAMGVLTLIIVWCRPQWRRKS